MNFLFKKKRYAVFLIKENDTYQVEGVKIVKIQNTITYKGRTFIIDLEKPTYQKNLKTFYFFSTFFQILNTFFNI